MTGTCKNGQNISNYRSKIVNVLRVLVEDFFSYIDKVLKTVANCTAEIAAMTEAIIRITSQGMLPRFMPRQRPRTNTPA
jgi:hypothetical protein